MTPRIVVIGGGPSAEREISLRSAQAIYEALKSTPGTAVELRAIDTEIPEDLTPENDILFLATHGVFGEDGLLQGMLDKKGFVYTGCDATASCLCFRKQLAKHLAERMGVDVPQGVAFYEVPNAVELYAMLGPKMVLKPEAQGSSVGLHIVESQEQLEKILPSLGKECYLAEQFIEGREITVGYLNGQALVPVEIMPEGGVYDTTHKYTEGKTTYQAPANLSPSQNALLKHTTERLCRAAGVRDFARVDYRLAPSGKLVFLEINTLPGMTPTSLLPKSAEPLGYNFSSLIRAMLNGARARFVDKYALKLATTR